METKDEHQILKSAALAIADSVRSPKTDFDQSYCPRIQVNENPACYLYLRLERVAGKYRISVSGNFHFPKPTSNNPFGMEYVAPKVPAYKCITVDAYKSFAQIATDVKRRFLPGYLEAFRVSQAAFDSCKTFDDKTAFTRGVLEKVCGDTKSAHSKDSYFTLHTTRGNGESLRLEFEVSGDKVTFKAGSMDLSTAVRTIEILKSL